MHLHTKVFCLFFTIFTILCWVHVVGSPVRIQARQAPVTGQVVTGGFATFFLQGGAAGACGQVNPDSALIAAMDAAIFSQSLCGRQVSVTNAATQQSVTVTIADKCPGCKNAQSIDLSQGAFDTIASEAQGVVPITWILL